MKTCTLINLQENIWMVQEESEIDLIYSEDDDNRSGAGWYFQKGGSVSQSFTTQLDAIIGYKMDHLIFKP